MFKLAPELKSIAVPIDRVAAVIEGLGTPSVAIPGFDAEPTRSCVVGVRNLDSSFSLLIHLFQPESERAAIYMSDPRSFPLAHFSSYASEAVQFIESMGFLVDDLNFGKLSPDKRSEIVKRLPAFHEAKPPPRKVASFDELEDLGDEGVQLQQLEELEPLAPVQSGEVALPQATVESSGMLALSKADLAEVADAFSSGFVQDARPLTPEQRRALLQLLSAF